MNSSVNGSVFVEPTGDGKWHVVADVRGLAPNTNHLVMLQPMNEDGVLLDRIGLCYGMSDDAGVFNCDWTNVDMFPGIQSSVITVMGGMVEEGYPPVVASGTWDDCDGH